MKDFVEFFNGQKMPNLGLGTWMVENPEELETAMNAAFDAGYRHFDTAFYYQNEKELGIIINEWISSGKVKREELFITTKLHPIAMDESRVERFIKLSLTSLGLDYVDLYLIHSPIGYKYVNDETLFPKDDQGNMEYDMSTDLLKVWAAMEKQVEAGRAKAIGLSNFWPSQIERIMKVAKILPANLQSECNVYYQQKETRTACKKYGITFCAYAPLGSPGRKTLYDKRGKTFNDHRVFDDPVVLQIAKNHGKSVTQVLLRFLTQQTRNSCHSKKCKNPTRILDNAKIFDFDLTTDEMKRLEGLDKGLNGRTFIGLPGADKHPEFKTS